MIIAALILLGVIVLACGGAMLISHGFKSSGSESVVSTVLGWLALLAAGWLPVLPLL